MKKLFLFLTAVICFTLAAQAQRTVTGVVIDGETDEPLMGASVVPIGGGTGIAADLDGKFTLNIPANVKQLRVSYIGFETQTVAVAPQMRIVMKTNNALETVVVTGYGSGKKLGSVVGAVSVVGEEQFQNTPSATFIDALQGQVSGLSIASNSGDPSSTNNSVRLRGVNSINASNTPLYIMDGAPITSDIFTTLNPSDIESVTVLKDAASVAIYGSRAANGVIVITTKKGKFGQMAKVNIRAAYGWSGMASDKIDMMDSRQYIQYRDLINQPVTEDARYAADVLGINTKWVDEVFSSSAPTYSIEGTVQGGSESMSYFLSLNHYAQEGIISNSDMRREGLRANITGRVNPWFRIGFNANLGYTKYMTNSESNASYDSSLYSLNPVYFARGAYPYDSPNYYTIDPETGRAIYGAKADYLHFSQLPTIDYINRTRNIWRNKVTLNATVFEQLNPIEGLTIRAQQNVDALDYRGSGKYLPNTILTTPMGDTYDWDGSLTGSASQAFQRSYSFTYTNTAEYSRTFNDVHNATILLGEESIITNAESFSANNAGYTDARLMLLQQGTEEGFAKNYMSNSYGQQVFNSWFANASYDYDGKYFLEGTVRRDGSSKFAPGHRWSTFWSVGNMWNMKQESFLRDITWLSDLKFHISYGTTGNSGIGNYAYFGTVGQGGMYNGQPSLGLGNPRCEDLTWETVKSFDIGFNFGLFNRINGEIDFYSKKTSDMLMEIPYSYTTGYSGGSGNVGDMRNEGIDFNVTADIIKTRDWFWQVRCNFNYNHNRILRLFDDLDEYNPGSVYLTTYKVGHSAGELYLVRYAGVDPRDGRQMWLDKNDNLTKNFNDAEDAILTGKNYHAPWSGGFGTDIRWKTLSLRADFAWSAKKYMINNDLWFIENSNMLDNNMMTSMLNIWTTEGQVTDIPKYGEQLQFDDRWLEDASYLRLKTLTLTYGLPRNILNKMHLDALNIHFTGRNLLTFTSFTGYDPEPERNLVLFLYPNTRQYEVGIEVGF